MRVMLAWFAIMLVDMLGQHWNMPIYKHDTAMAVIWWLAFVLCLALDLKELFR